MFHSNPVKRFSMNFHMKLFVSQDFFPILLQLSKQDIHTGKIFIFL